MINNEKFWQKIIDAIQGNPFSGIWALAAFLCVAVFTAGSTSAANLVSSLMGAAAGISVGSAIAYKWWSKATHREESLERRGKELAEREERAINSIKQREDKMAEREGLFQETTQRNLDLQRNVDEQNSLVQQLQERVNNLHNENENLNAKVESIRLEKDSAYDHLETCIDQFESLEVSDPSNKGQYHNLKGNLVQAQRMLRNK